MYAERHRQRGQALVELTVAVLALVPLYFGIAWVARVLDVQHATLAAARALAFECTVRPDACAAPAAHPELALETRLRHFAGHAVALRSDAVDTGAREAFWVDRRGEPLLERLDDVTIDVARLRFDSPLAFAGGLGGSFSGAVRTLSTLAGPGRFGFELDGGFVEARVRARVAPGRPEDGWVRRLTAMPLVMSARTAILTDAWNASGPYGEAPDSVESRVAAGSRLPGVQPAVDAGWLPVRGLLAIGAALGVESSAELLRWHEIDVDLVPPDRLARLTEASGDPPGEPSAPPSHDRP
jgi:hypothetical protein